MRLGPRSSPPTLSLDRCGRAERRRAVELGAFAAFASEGHSLFRAARAAIGELETLVLRRADREVVSAPPADLAEIRIRRLPPLPCPTTARCRIRGPMCRQRMILRLSALKRIVSRGLTASGTDTRSSTFDRAEVMVLAREGNGRRARPRFVPGGRFLLVTFPRGRSYELWDLERGVVPEKWPNDGLCAARHERWQPCRGPAAGGRACRL